MSKENAIKFFKLTAEKPELLEEAKKHSDAENFCDALSKVAKEKGFECSAKELEEAESVMSNLSSDELDEADLESVAGGSWLSDRWNDVKGWISNNSDQIKAAWNGAKKGWSEAKKPEPATTPAAPPAAAGDAATTLTTQ